MQVTIMGRISTKLAIVNGAFAVIAVSACGAPSSGLTAAPSTSAPSATPTMTAPSSSPHTRGPVAHGRAKICQASALTIALVHSGAVAGQVGAYIKFTNHGRTDCRLDGWPSVEAETVTAKSASASRAVHGTMFGAWQYEPPEPVLLKPGASGYAVVAAGDHSINTSARCPTYRWLRVHAPGTSGHVILSAWLPGATTFMPACISVAGSPEIEISAVVPLSHLAH